MVNWHTFFFLLFALLSCGAALAVILANSIVRMAVYLILSLTSVSGLFFLAGAEFVGAMQLMIYVGGTLVLLVFGVMLTAHNPLSPLKAKGAEWIFAVLAAVVLLAMVMVPAILAVPAWQPPEDQAIEMQAPPTEIGTAFLGLRMDSSPESGIVSGYLLPFELISVYLLVVLIGAAYLARTKRREVPHVHSPLSN